MPALQHLMSTSLSPVIKMISDSVTFHPTQWTHLQLIQQHIQLTQLDKQWKYLLLANSLSALAVLWHFCSEGEPAGNFSPYLHEHRYLLVWLQRILRMDSFKLPLLISNSTSRWENLSSDSYIFLCWLHIPWHSQVIRNHFTVT